jgi:hypothetical protein
MKGLIVFPDKFSTFKILSEGCWYQISTKPSLSLN